MKNKELPGKDSTTFELVFEQDWDTQKNFIFFNEEWNKEDDI